MDATSLATPTPTPLQLNCNYPICRYRGDTKGLRKEKIVTTISFNQFSSIRLVHKH